MRAFFTLLFLVAGCGEPLVHGELSDLRRRLDEAQRRQTTAEQKVEELEDRVFLLTDQIESQKVAASRRDPPRLPVVTLRPTTNEEAPGPDEASGDVEYQGDARTTSSERARPVVHLDGSGSRPARSSPVRDTSFVDTLPATRENLGVAPAPTLPTASPRGERDSRPAQDPLKLYRTAYDDLRAGHHDQAARGFRDFVRLYPHHDYADNAQYWLGECFYDRKQYVEAAGEFRSVVARYPTGNKAPDALLKLGYCLLASGDARGGRDLLVQVPTTYPRTEAARLAAERLAELKELQ